MTLEDTKAEIASVETKLLQLKDEKHQLFNTLKKVLARTTNNLNPQNNHSETVKPLSPPFQSSRFSILLLSIIIIIIVVFGASFGLRKYANIFTDVIIKFSFFLFSFQDWFSFQYG